MFRPITRDKKTRWQLRDDARPPYEPWRWPLQALGSRDPVVLAEHVNGDRRGIDIGYNPRPDDAQLYVPVYAAQSGEVAYASENSAGFCITLDHGHHDWATHYAHLSRMFVAENLGRRTRRRHFVRGGDVIGYAAKSPIHIRFELWDWRHERGFVPVEPVETMKHWVKIPGRDDADRKAA